MIECPICHVNNEDQAHFCSECGQRFNPSMQAGGSPAASATPPWQQQTSPPQVISQPQPLPLNFGQPAAPPDFGGQSSSGAFGQSMPDPVPQTYAPQSPPAGFGAPPAPAGFPPAASGMPGGSPVPGFAPTDFASAPPTDFGYPQVANPSSFVESPPAAPSQAFAESAPSSATGRSFAAAQPEPVPLFSAPPAPEPEHIEPPKPARPRLHSPMLGGHDDEPDEPPAPSSSGKRSLRSPLLRGSDDDPPEDMPGQNKSKGRLRSPLLRGEDEDETPAPRSSKGGKSGGLRSPLLGGSDDDDAPPSAFPHRNRNTEPVQPVPEDSANKPRPRLHSPMLGGGEDDHDEPVARGGQNRGVDPRPSIGGRRRLHFPVLDGTGEFDYEAWGQGDQQSYDEDDPNVLRSPLLAARQKLPVEKPAPAADLNRAPGASAAPTQPLPAPIPQALPQPQQPPQFQQPAASFQQAGFAQPPQSVPDSQYMQQMEAPPAYVPLTNPQSSTSLAAQTYAEPVLHEHPVSEPLPPPAAPAPSTVSRTDHTPGGRGRSALHSDEKSSRVPLGIYDSGLRETIPGTIKSGPALIIVVPALLGLLAKGFYLTQLMATPNIMQNTGFLVDFGAQAILLLGLLIFGLSANKKY